MRKKNDLNILLFASVATVILWFIPFAQIVTYPFLIFATFIHEWFHAFVVVCTGGMVNIVQIYPDGSGLTVSRGGIRVLILNAGYMGTIFYGGMMLMLCRSEKFVPIVLGVSALIILFTIAVWVRPVFNFGFIMGSFLVLVIVCVIFLEKFAYFIACFLAIQSCFNGIESLRKVVLVSFTSQPIITDAFYLEQLTAIPAFVWTALWVIFSIVVLFIAVRSYRKSSN